MSRLLDRWTPPRVEPKPRSLCDAGRLLMNPDFQALFTDQNSPVAQKLASLELAIRDTEVVELPKIMALKGELAGLTFIRIALTQMAEEQAKEVGAATAAKPHPGLLPVRPS